MWRRAVNVCLLLAAGFVFAGEPRFEDVSESSGLNRLLEKPDGKRPWRYAHGAAWGDVDGDGRPDLFAGAFAARPYFRGEDSPTPNGLFLNTKSGFVRSDETALNAAEGNARCAGALFADLDGDGDLDLVVTNHVQGAKHEGSKLYENRGGHFHDVTPQAAPWTERLGMRNAAVLDVDRDGKLDLLLADGTYGREGMTKAKLLVLMNRGAWNFVEEGGKLGLPQDQTSGLGLALGDVNNDGRPDVFVAGSQRLFVTDKEGGFREAHSGRFAFPCADKEEGLHCGAAFGDLNNDGLLDLVTTEHGVPAKIHVFHNQGIEDGAPNLVEVSTDCGLGETLPRGTRQRPIKTAHVALKDIDCDGRVDVVTTLLAHNSAGKLQPVVLLNEGQARGPIKLSAIPRDELVGYFAPGPVADFDRDGRVDIFLPSWFEDLPNYLFRNATKDNQPLTVQVKGPTMGIGAVVVAYQAGDLGDEGRRITQAEITIGNGYASGEEALAHLGLGAALTCDLRVSWQGRTFDRRGVKAGTFVVFHPDEQPTALLASPDKTFPPELPDGKSAVSFTSDEVLQRPEGFSAEIAIAKTAPRIDFRYYPGQDYEGKPWSNWGDASFAVGKYFSAIGDHLAPRGRAFVFMFDPEKDELKVLCDITKTVNLPEGHYTPGKVHTHVEMGRDGKVYFATHRGSTKATTDANHFTGEWILRADPATGKSEVVVRGPVPKHCIPNGVLDPERLIYYGGTAPGVGGDGEGIRFFAYDIEKKKVLFDGADGPARAMILTKAGKVYYTPGNALAPLMRFDPAVGKPEEIAGKIGIRAATGETAAGKVFTCSQGNKEAPTTLFAFDVKTEQVEPLGPAAVGKNEYVAALKADPSGRYLYYIPGAHGSADADGSPIVQYDTQTKTRKVLAFVAPFLTQHFGCTPKGTYGWALDDRGERLFVTWNVSRGGKNWDCCGLMTLHIPAGERPAE